MALGLKYIFLVYISHTAVFWCALSTGVVDDFQVYGRVLSDSEVSTLFDSSACGESVLLVNYAMGRGGYVVSSCSRIKFNDVLLWLLSGTPGVTYSVDFNAGETSVSGNDVGVIGAAFGLDGTNSFQVAHQASYDPAQFTVALWVDVPSDFTSSATTNTPWVACKNTDDTTEGYIGVKAAADGSVDATINIGGTAYTINGASSSSLSTCSWNHVALTYDGTTLALYVNGGLAGENTVGLSRVAGTGDWVFGGRCDSVGDSNLVGAVDEVGLFGRGLSSSEVALLYADHAATAAAGDTVGFWAFGEVKSTEELGRAEFANAQMEVSVQRAQGEHDG